MTQALPSETPRSLDRCPNCAYLLKGLPDVGRCPECGHEYSQAFIMVHGWGGADDQRGQFGRRGWSQLIATLMPAAFISFLMWPGFGGRSRSTVPGWLFLLPFAAAAAAFLISRAGRDDAPPVQLAMHPDGWVWGYSRGSRERLILYRLCIAGIYAPLYFLWFRHSPAVPVIYITIYAICLAASVLWRRIRNWGRRPSQQDEARQWLSWSTIDHIQIARQAPGTWRIQLASKGAMKSFRLGSYRKSFTFLCDMPDARASHIAAQLSAWQAPLKPAALP